MNILHLEASPGWGGQEIRILREAEGMRNRGHTVTMAVRKGGGLVSEGCKAGFTVYEIYYQKRFWLYTLFRLMALMHRHRIDLVNTHSSLDSWIGGLAARLMRIPIVRTRHLSTPIKSGLNSRLLYGFLTDYIVTTCSSILPMISQFSGKSRSLMSCIATGVDPDRMKMALDERQDFRSALGVKPNDFLVGTACFMRSWKGINDFLIAAHLLRDHSNLRWVIIGGGHQDAYIAKAKELNLDGIVHFTGHLPNPIPAIAALDAFALLSTAHEGVSQAILQAAYLGKPLIATSVGGLGEVCISGQTGISVQPFSPHDVTDAVLKLMHDRNLSLKFGDGAHQLVLNRFTLQQMLDDMEAVYQLVLKGVMY